MKYWRGYLTAAILAAITLAIKAFASAHPAIIDMVYPYCSRLVQTTLADWAAGMDFCLWQVLAVLLITAFLTSIVLVIIFRWNILQWLGWVLTAVSLMWMLHTGLYGLNYYAGPLADDIRLETTEFTVTELINATTYFRDQANSLSQEIPREEDGSAVYPDFDTLAAAAGNGFENLTFDRSYSVFAGSTAPVKKLGWSGLYSSMSIAGVTIAFTGEAAVNPNAPALSMPYTMCHEMAHRMCIASEGDANFAAFLACTANDDILFQYSGYFMAFRYCYNALSSIGTSTADNAAKAIFSGVSDNLKQDLQDYNAQLSTFYNKSASDAATAVNDAYLKASGVESGVDSYGDVCNLMVSWYVQEIYLPEHQDEEVGFDPTDRNQVDLGDSTGGN